VASLAKRWLPGTHQGSVSEAHLPAYLDEFVFRFNRRRSSSRGMVFYRVLELAAGHDPIRFHDLLADKKPRPAPHARGWGHPPSLDRPVANRPWRTGELQLQLPIPLRLSEYPRHMLSHLSPGSDPSSLIFTARADIDENHEASAQDQVVQVKDRAGPLAVLPGSAWSSMLA
jgi:hypothetical protein